MKKPIPALLSSSVAWRAFMLRSWGVADRGDRQSWIAAWSKFLDVARRGPKDDIWRIAAQWSME